MPGESFTKICVFLCYLILQHTSTVCFPEATQISRMMEMFLLRETTDCFSLPLTF